MKRRYFGDKRDFFKYDLVLETMESTPVLEELLFIPMLTPDDEGNDGQIKRYQPGTRRICLYEFLQATNRQAMVEGKPPQLACLGDYFGIYRFQFNLYQGAEYFVHSSRADYFAGVPVSLEKASLVFLDPDNGFEVKSMQPGTGHRYVRYDELKALVSCTSSKSVFIVYQHLPRIKRDVFVPQLLENVHIKVGG